MEESQLIDVESSPQEEPSISVMFDEEFEIDESHPDEISDAFEVATISEDHTISDEPVVYFIEEDRAEDFNETSLAKDLISDKLEADEIVSEEIGRVSEEDIDIALEALSSDEAVAIDEAEERPAEEIDDSVKEFAEILGTLDSYEKEPVVVDEDDEDEMGFSDYLAEELDDILSKIQKAGKLPKDED